MDGPEARTILDEQLARFGKHTEVAPLAASEYVENIEIRGPSGAIYYIEIQFFWDDDGKRNVRVFGSIDDGGIRSYVPITQTLLVFQDA